MDFVGLSGNPPVGGAAPLNSFASLEALHLSLSLIAPGFKVMSRISEGKFMGLMNV